MGLELQAVAIEVAQEAAAHVRRRRSELFAEVKSDGPALVSSTVIKSSPTDPVTIVDTESEELIRSALARLRPGDTVFGEEGGGPTGSESGYRWVVDPIDGTVNFLYGLPAYAVSIAVQAGEEFIAGAVADVSTGEVYTAALGAGAYLISADGTRTRLQVTDARDLELSLVATGFGYAAARRAEQGRIVAGLLPQVRDIRRLGSAAIDLCLLAAGRVDAYYEHGLNVWDWAAGALIAYEAGAAISIPSASTPGMAGEIMAAAAPGVARQFAEALQSLDADSPIPA